MDELSLTRRPFFSRTATGIGVAALSSLLEGQTTLPHHPPKAKRVIYLFQHGAPSQLDLFDYKPNLAMLRAPIPVDLWSELKQCGLIEVSAPTP